MDTLALVGVKRSPQKGHNTVMLGCHMCLRIESQAQRHSREYRSRTAAGPSTTWTYLSAKYMRVIVASGRAALDVSPSTAACWTAPCFVPIASCGKSQEAKVASASAAQDTGNKRHGCAYRATAHVHCSTARLHIRLYPFRNALALEVPQPHHMVAADAE